MIAVEQNQVDFVRILLADDRVTLTASQFSIAMQTSIDNGNNAITRLLKTFTY
jgi:hypothetical protein